MKKLAVLFTSLLLALPASSFAAKSSGSIAHPIGDGNSTITKPSEITTPWLLIESRPILYILYICTWQRSTVSIDGITRTEKQTHLGLGSCIRTMPKN